MVSHYTTRMLRNYAMPGSLTPKHKNKYGILVMMIIIIIHCATRLELGEEKSGRHATLEWSSGFGMVKLQAAPPW